MTKDEILSKAKYIQYCLKNKTYKNFGIPSEKINKLPIVNENMFYSNWSLNEHHFTTEYHMKYSIPLLCNILSLDYNRNKFVLDKRFSGDYNISILKPRKKYEYEIYGFNRNEHFDNLSFNDITSNNINHKSITDYHKLYKYPHECSRLINKTIKNNRKLFISCDSQMIPDVSFLSCFFKEIWVIDNRAKLPIKDKYKDVEFTDVLIQLNIGSYETYFINNFK